MKNVFEKPLVYAFKHKSDEVVAGSRSGGFFTAVSDSVLENNGVVYGCVMNEQLKAVHFRAASSEERDKMRGSKYVQSNLLDTFSSVKKDLSDNIKVLFTGTSCQVAGLKAYLNDVDTKNLVCVDIVCHGVPSHAVFDSYIKWQEEQNKSDCVEIDFRNKVKYGWREHVETLKFSNGKEIDSRIFTTIFYDHSVLRPSCYDCPYKSVIHPGDISIADYWGIEKAAPEFDDNKGTSLVLINNEYGKEIFDKVSSKMNYKACLLDDSMQPPFYSSYSVPARREMFWKSYKNNDFSKIVKNYGGVGLVSKVYKRLKQVKHLVNQIIKK